MSGTQTVLSETQTVSQGGDNDPPDPPDEITVTPPSSTTIGMAGFGQVLGSGTHGSSENLVDRLGNLSLTLDSGTQPEGANLDTTHPEPGNTVQDTQGASARLDRYQVPFSHRNKGY